jgi:hypothetical protein
VTGSAAERRAAALRQAAQAKRQAAVTRTETDDLRTRIERLRDQQRARPVPEPGPERADGSDIVHILIEKLRRERDTRRTTVSQLEEQLAAAHGELLRLRVAGVRE